MGGSIETIKLTDSFYWPKTQHAKHLFSNDVVIEIVVPYKNNYLTFIKHKYTITIDDSLLRPAWYLRQANNSLSLSIVFSSRISSSFVSFVTDSGFSKVIQWLHLWFTGFWTNSDSFYITREIHCKPIFRTKYVCSSFDIFGIRTIKMQFYRYTYPFLLQNNATNKYQQEALD